MTTKLALTYLEICSWLENVALPSNRALYRRPYNQNPLCSDGDPEVIELEFFNGAQKSFLKAQILESYFFTAGLGYRIFPSSVILSHLIASKPSIVMNRKVLELGAGVGLSGIVASLLGANRTVLSDSIHELLKSLERNAKHNCWKAYKERKISVKYLDWNPNSTNPPLETPTLSQRTFNHVKNEKFDIIIGADILYEFEFAEWLPAVIVSHLNAPSRGTRRSDYKSLEIQPELSANDGKTGQPATVGDESTFASVLNCAAIFVSPTRDMRILNHFVNKLQGVGFIVSAHSATESALYKQPVKAAAAEAAVATAAVATAAIGTARAEAATAVEEAFASHYALPFKNELCHATPGGRLELLAEEGEDCLIITCWT